MVPSICKQCGSKTEPDGRCVTCYEHALLPFELGDAQRYVVSANYRMPYTQDLCALHGETPFFTASRRCARCWTTQAYPRRQQRNPARIHARQAGLEFFASWCDTHEDFTPHWTQRGTCAECTNAVGQPRKSRAPWHKEGADGQDRPDHPDHWPSVIMTVRSVDPELTAWLQLKHLEGETLAAVRRRLDKACSLIDAIVKPH